MNFGQERLFKSIENGGEVSLTDHTLLSLDRDMIDSRGLTALSLAIVKDNKNVFDVMMRLPPEKIDGYLSKADSQGRFPVEIAAKSDTPYFLATILAHNPRLVDQKNEKTGCVIMHMLLRNEEMGLGINSQKEMMATAKSYGPDMGIRNKQGETPAEAISRLTGITVDSGKTM